MVGDRPAIYEDLMRFRPEGMTPNAWAMKAGVSRTVWADMRRHGNPSRRTLEKLLTAAGSSLAEFEALRIGAAAQEHGSMTSVADRSAGWGGQQLPPIPLVATAIGGKWGDPHADIELTELRAGQVVDRLPRPASLASEPSAYAITIVGDSMWPRFRPGRRIAVSPRTPAAIGDDVVLKLKADESGVVPMLIKELVRMTGSGVQLRQFNPDLTFEVPSADIEAIEKVAGELF